MKNRKGIIVVIMIVLVVVLVGTSYALWQITLQQESTNIVTTGCFRIEFQDKNSINLEEVLPITDEDGKNLVPYTFTIENICTTIASYQVNLEEMNIVEKKLSDEYVKIALNDNDGYLLSSYDEVDTTIDDAFISRKLTTGVLKPNSKKIYDVRMWLDKDTPLTGETANATFKSKVTVIATLMKDIPEVEVSAFERQDGIEVNVNTIKNDKDEILRYFYRLDNEEEIASEENIYVFTTLRDGKYKVKVRIENGLGIILEEEEIEVVVAYEKVYVSSSGNDSIGNGSKDSPYKTLNLAYKKVKSSGEIILLSDIIVNSTTTMDITNKEVILTSLSDDIYKVTKDATFTTQILDIKNNNTVTTTNITFDGNNVISSAALIELHDSTLNLNKGTTVQNNNNRGRFYEERNSFGARGGGLLVANSTLNINGAIITKNKTSAQSGAWSHGAGMFVEFSTVTLNSGVISNNENIGNIVNQIGGGLQIYCSKFYMNGGKIINNKTPKGGGGIYINSENTPSIMIMTDGIISNNTVIENAHGSEGGGIVASIEFNGNSPTTVYLRGGKIENNIASFSPDMYARSGAQIIDER